MCFEMPTKTTPIVYPAAARRPVCYRVVQNMPELAVCIFHIMQPIFRRQASLRHSHTLRGSIPIWIWSLNPLPTQKYSYGACK